MTDAFGKVALLYGGDSAERDISLVTGTAILAALQRRGVDVVGIDTQGAGLQQLLTGSFDRAFIALHGRGGEDGTMQGLLEQLNIPYTGSGILGSALAMDKHRTKQVWRGMDLPTPRFEIVTQAADLTVAMTELGLPLIIKPALEGSSVGVAKVTDAQQLQTAWQAAAYHHCAVMAEEFIAGREYTVAILGDTALPLIWIEPAHDWYDYDAKYQDAQTQYHCPCGLPPEQEHTLQSLALSAFKAVGASGWGRVDFILDAAERPWLLEVNTVPGMTSHSLVPMAAKAAGIEFDALVMQVLATAV